MVILEKRAQGISDTGLIADQFARFAPDGEGIRVIFEVVENPIITGFQFEGNSLVSSDELVSLMTCKIGCS